MPKKIHDSLIDIVNILQDGQYHDGTSIGQKLKMTRSAVWKAIKRLEKYEVEMDSIKGKGYHLREPFILLDQNEIRKKIQHPIKIEIFEIITSTNEYLKNLKNVTVPTVCISEYQTHGKARLNRKWYSPFGKNLYLSCRFPFKKDVSELAGLSLVTGLAVLGTLKKYGLEKNIFVKWPNDVYYDFKKISGILLEIQAESHDGLVHAIIGIGINVNILYDDHDQISQPWISMQKILKRYIDRNELASQLINCLLTYLHQFEDQGFSPFMQKWMQSDCLIDKRITLKNLKNSWSGVVKGINDQGQLLLELGDGQVKAFSSGDVTVKKVL